MQYHRSKSSNTYLGYAYDKGGIVMKKRIFKIIGIIIIILIILILIHTLRNYFIITDLQNKISQYSNSSNYYIKSIATEENGTIITMEYYKKDIKQVVFLERNLNGEISKISMYDNGERTDTFCDNKANKIAQLNSGTIMTVNIYNRLETDNKWQTLLSSITSKIKSVTYNGKECYAIKDFISATPLSFEDAEIYIEKDTGLFVKMIEGNVTTEREYKFDNVDDKIFTEPDISKYNLKENE